MRTKSLLLTTVILGVSALAHGNEFVRYYQVPTPIHVSIEPKPVETPQSALAPVVTVDQMEDTVRLESVPRPLPRPEGRGDDSGSEVVSGREEADVEVPQVAPIPMPADRRPAPTTTTAAAPQLYDMTNCRYGTDCWRSFSLTQKIRKVVANVDQINSLHGTQLDPRYMLCTGYRESRFNPGARGRDGERGMFQIMRATGRAAVAYDPKVQEFKNYDTRGEAETYMTKMVNSSLAQTELSFLTLKMKVAENSSISSKVLSGGATVAQYKRLAKAYNGAGAAAERYSNKIANCLTCMREKLSDVHAATITESQVRTCLNKATN